MNAEVDPIELTTCLCGVTYRWTEGAQAAEHRSHRRSRWVQISNGGWPPKFGPWHRLDNGLLATAACGASLFRRSDRDTRRAEVQPADRLCKRCAAIPLPPWGAPTSPDGSAVTTTKES